MAEKYFEFIEHDISNRGNIISLDDGKRILPVRRNYPSYTSMFLFDEDIVNHVKDLVASGKKPSVTGFVGRCYMNYLWLDIDTPDETKDVEKNIRSTIEETKKIIDNMIVKYNMKENNFKIYFSGNKGFHIGIPAHLFGAENYSSEALPAICKVLAKEISDGSRMVDSVIYNTVRIFRTPNSQHEKSGYYKVQVSYQTIANLSSDTILQNSEFCVNEQYTLDLLPNQALTMMFQECCKKASKHFDILSTVSGEDNTVLKNKTLFRLPEKGTRNDSIFRMGVKLFSIPKNYLSNEQCIDLLRMISDAVNTASVIRGQDPLTEHEVRTYINQSFKYTRLNQTINAIEARNITDLALKVYNYATNARFISTGIQEFDEDLGGGGILGNLYSVIGRGGTMKSIFLQNLLINDCKAGNQNIYLNMEMSENEFFDRTCKIILQKNFIEMVRSGDIKREDIQKIQHEIHDVIGTRLIVVNENDLSPTDIEDIVKRKQDESGSPIRAIVADSSSAMAMVGSNDEVKTAVYNSKELKQVAKRQNVCIFLINHCNNQAPVTMRDVSTFVRGGSKTIDNGDAYFCLSKIIDRDRSDFFSVPKDIVYLQGYTYVRFVNKRESGNTLDKVITIADDLVMDVCEEDAKSFNF